MISVLLQKLNDVEKKLADQQKQLCDVRAKVVNNYIDDEEIESGQPSVRNVLFRLQGSVKCNTLAINELKSRCAFHDIELKHLRANLTSRQRQQAPIDTGWTFQAPHTADLNTRPVDENGNEYQRAGIVGGAGSLCLETATPIGVPMSHDPVDRSNSSAPFQQPTQAAPSATRNSNDTTWNVARLRELERELKQKDLIIQELLQKQEEFLQKEKDYIQKQDWYEHKMRLLKQDKRRRGETIGKLLRSIDEMRDAGKLDLSRAREGRTILQTTLQTRGMTQEERIDAAINVADAERSPRHKESLTLQDLVTADTEERQRHDVFTPHFTPSPPDTHELLQLADGLEDLIFNDLDELSQESMCPTGDNTKSKQQ